MNAGHKRVHSNFRYFMNYTNKMQTDTHHGSFIQWYRPTKWQNRQTIRNPHTCHHGWCMRCHRKISNFIQFYSSAFEFCSTQLNKRNETIQRDQELCVQTYCINSLSKLNQLTIKIVQKLIWISAAEWPQIMTVSHKMYV